MPADSATITSIVASFGVLLVLAFVVLCLWCRMIRSAPPELRNLLHGIIPDPEDIIVPSLPDGWQAIFPHAGEVFFSRLPHAGAVIEIEITGECRYHWTDATLKRADARYRAEDGRFTEQHREIKIDDKYLTSWHYHDCFEIVENRGEHRYRIRIDLPQTGHQVGIAFGNANERHVHPNLGFLKVRVTPLPADTPSIAERRKQERKRERARKDAAAAAEEMAQAVKKLSIRSQVMRNWEDPDFCAKFARVHCDELLQNQGAIRQEASSFLEQHQLVQYLRKHNPSAVKTILGRLESLLAAERIALDKAIAAADAPKPLPQEAPALPPAPVKKRLTTEEVRAIKVRRQRVQDQDKVDLKIDKIETRLQIRERLQKLPLDDDERDMLEQELFREIEEGEDNDTAKTI